VLQSGKIAVKGPLGWLAHRGYHGLAMPSWERKWRVIGGWWNNFWLGRDIVSLLAVQNPRINFEEFAARPKPAVEAAAPEPAKKATRTKADAEQPAEVTAK
jgi:NADH dehydrogenase